MCGHFRAVPQLKTPSLMVICGSWLYFNEIMWNDVGNCMVLDIRINVAKNNFINHPLVNTMFIGMFAIAMGGL